MKHFNKIASVCCSFALGLLAVTSCEDERFYNVNSPDWLSERVDSIANEEDASNVYIIGNTDYSSVWWVDFSEYYTIPLGGKWEAVFNLHINPNATNTYKNFALIITNDVDRGGTGYAEYGAIRFDNQPSGNSEWGTYIDRSCVESTLTFETDTDPGIENLGGEVTLTVDRTSLKEFNVTMTNGVVTKTYKQPSALVNLNEDKNNTNIRCFLVVEGSYIEFLQSTIEQNELTDSNPASLELQNVPSYVNIGTPLDSIVKDVTGVVTFAAGGTTTVSADELVFSAIPDLEDEGIKTLVAVYNKTFLGENCDQPVMASASFEVVEKVEAIEVAVQPTHTAYYYYTSEATETLTDRTLAFDPTDMEVTATYANGDSKTIDNSRLTFSAVPATVGTHQVTITADEGVTATVEVTVAESPVSAVSNTAAVVGAEDNSTVFLGAFSDNFSVGIGETKSIAFTNYSSLVSNWNNYVVVLHNGDTATPYAYTRADNWSMDPNFGELICNHSGTQGDWATWLAGMNGAEVTVYVTNCGNNTAEVQAIMEGTTGTTSTQYYLGINVDADNLGFALTVDGSHLVFE